MMLRSTYGVNFPTSGIPFRLTHAYANNYSIWESRDQKPRFSRLVGRIE